MNIFVSRHIAIYLGWDTFRVVLNLVYLVLRVSKLQHANYKGVNIIYAFLNFTITYIHGTFLFRITGIQTYVQK